MSKVVKRFKELNKVKRVRVITSGDIYYTYSDWETKMVEGVEFVYVLKSVGLREMPKLMRKDSLEYMLK